MLFSGSSKINIVIIACPGSGGIIGCESTEPDIVFIRGCSGFTCNCCSAEITGGTGSFFNNIFHCAGKQKSSSSLDYLFGLRSGIIENHISFMIHNFGIKLRFNIGATICNSRKTGIQFDVFYTFGNTAQSKGLCDIGVNFSLDLFIIDQGCKTEIFQVVKSELRGYECKRFDCNDIHGICDTGSQRGQSTIFLTIPVSDRPSV